MHLMPSVRFSKIEYPGLPESGSIFSRIAKGEFKQGTGARPILENYKAYVLLDANPVSQGHALVIPRREIPSSQGLTDDERLAMWQLVENTKQKLLGEYPNITGFNIGWNDGVGAGQTIGHLHIHVIPRYKNDLFDKAMEPIGGIRGILMDPYKKDYKLEGNPYYPTESYAERVKQINAPFNREG